MVQSRSLTEINLRGGLKKRMKATSNMSKLHFAFTEILGDKDTTTISE